MEKDPVLGKKFFSLNVQNESKNLNENSVTNALDEKIKTLFNGQVPIYYYTESHKIIDIISYSKISEYTLLQNQLSMVIDKLQQWSERQDIAEIDTLNIFKRTLSFLPTDRKNLFYLTVTYYFSANMRYIMPKSNKQSFLPRTKLKLITAVINNNISVTEALLKQGANPNQIIAANGGRLLHLAARYGFLAIVDLLLQHGAKASINIKNKYGYTPLHEVLSSNTINENHEAIVLLLLQYGANLFIKDNLKQTPLQLVTQSRNAPLRELFSEILRKLLKKAVLNNHLTATKFILDTGISVNQTDNTTGCTLLHLAAQYNALEAAALLLRHGADVDRLSNSGSTALHYAASNNHIDMVVIIISIWQCYF